MSCVLRWCSGAVHLSEPCRMNQTCCFLKLLLFLVSFCWQTKRKKEPEHILKVTYICPCPPHPCTPFLGPTSLPLGSTSCLQSRTRKRPSSSWWSSIFNNRGERSHAPGWMSSLILSLRQLDFFAQQPASHHSVHYLLLSIHMQCFFLLLYTLVFVASIYAPHIGNLSRAIGTHSNLLIGFYLRNPNQSQWIWLKASFVKRDNLAQPELSLFLTTWNKKLFPPAMQ